MRRYSTTTNLLKTADPSFRIGHYVGWSLVALLSLVHGITLGQDAEQPIDGAPSVRAGHLIQITLPIDTSVAGSVEQSLKRILEESKNVLRADDRPIVVLEFDTANFRTGRGSQLESCLALARLLTSSELNQIKTVAFVPPVQRITVRDDNVTDELKATSQLSGHAVLVALAADELVVASGATLGQASADEKNLDNLVREVYRSISQKRLTLPTPVAMSMVDPTLELFRVTTNTGAIYVDRAKLEELESAGHALQTETLATAGTLATFSGADLARYNLTREIAESRVELAQRFNLDPDSLEGDPTQGRNWNAIQISLPEYIDSKLVDWSMRAIETRLNSGDTNLFIFRFNSGGGEPESCIRLAQRIAELDSNKIRTVAFINNQASGPAGIVALACDHLIMTEQATLGGAITTPIDEDLLSDLRNLVVPIAERKQVASSLMIAMIQPEIEVLRFRNVDSGDVRFLTLDEQARLPNAENWKLLGPIETLEGIKTPQADQFGLTRLVVTDFDQVKTFYQLTSDPPSLEPSATDRWLKEVAAYLASPFIAPLLLFGAVFFLSSEMSAPGLGIPGFVGTICLVLFFWSQSLDGNAHWLEILMFVTGAVFILLEIFVLPGVGIFGVGGLVMVVASIVLASQTFVVPLNSSQFNQMSLSLLTLAGAGLGFIVALVALRNVLPHTPMLRRIMLFPPEYQSTGLDGHDPESTVHWDHLVGRTGTAMTHLAPAGKAKINGRLFDVITDGRMIDKNQKVVVQTVTGNRITVGPYEKDGSNAE